MQIVHIEAYVSHILDVIMLSLLRVQLESRMKGKLWPNLNPYTKSLCYRGSNSVNSVGIFLFIFVLLLGISYVTLDTGL